MLALNFVALILALYVLHRAGLHRGGGRVSYSNRQADPHGLILHGEDRGQYLLVILGLKALVHTVLSRIRHALVMNRLII